MKKYKFIDCNKKTLKMFKVPKNQIIGQSPYKFSPKTQKNGKNSKELAKNYINQALAGIPQKFEWTHKKFNEAEFDAEISLNSLNIANEKYILAIVRDITERKNNERKLKESEEIFRLQYENYPLPTYTFRISGDDFNLIDMNKAADIYTEGKLRNLKIIKASKFFSERGYNDIFESMKKCAKFKKPIKQEFLYRFLSTNKKVFISCNFAFSPPNLVLLHTEDITSRKKVENELAAERERLAVTLRCIGDGVIATDIEGHILIMNKIAENLTGWNQNNVNNKQLSKILKIINEKTRKPIKFPLKEILEAKHSKNLPKNSILISKSGKEFVIADSIAPILDKNSEVIGAVIVFRDITEKKKIENEFIKRQKIESIGILAGGIAHDFNNILTSILGNISIAKLELDNFNLDKKETSEMLTILEDAETASLRANKLTKQLLTFSKGGAPIKKITSIKNTIEETARFVVRGSNSRLFIEVAQDLWNVDVDIGQISQVINNIVLNAIQSMPKGGNIIIEANNVKIGELPLSLNLSEQKFIQISILDQGSGISKQILSNVFDPYFTTKEKGSGLGLAVCYSIIKNHGGTITIDSKVNEGSIFNIYIPASEKNDLSIETSELSRISSGKGRLMVMDDEVKIQQVIKKMSKHIGYDVTVVSNGKSLISQVKQAKKKGFHSIVLSLI